MIIRNLPNPIVVLCQQAASFPAGILAAHQQLHQKVAHPETRQAYGISYPVAPGQIVYKAAVASLDTEEATAYGLECFTIRQGDYLTVNIHNYHQQIPAIGRAFQQLLQAPGIAPDGYCLEWYHTPNDVLCMVPLAATPTTSKN